MEIMYHRCGTGKAVRWGSAKGDVFAPSLCKSIPQGWAAGWGGGIAEPGMWHRGHQEWVIKLSELGCQYSLCAAFGAGDSALGELQHSSDTVVLLLGLLQ